MATDKRKLNEINSDKKQRSTLLLFKPNISKKACFDNHDDDTESIVDDDYKIPKFSIKRTVNIDSNLSEFKIETKTEDDSEDDEEDDDAESNENIEDDNDDDEEEIEDLSMNEEVEDEDENDEQSDGSKDDESESDNLETSHSIELIQSKQNLLKLKLKNLAETITTTDSNSKRSRPMKTKEQENEDQKMKGKRGRKPGYRKYPEGNLKPKMSSKTPRSITSYFLFCQVNRPKIAEKYPELKLRAIQRILSEQWNKLTDKERLIWRQKAVKLGKKGSKGMISTGIVPQVQIKSLKKIDIESTLKPIDSHHLINIVEKRVIEAVPPPPPVQEKKIVKTLPIPQNLSNFVEDCKPIDLAAHLNLIGESMTQFGNKILKSQEKANSLIHDSSFYILDAFICALGPIFSLTTQIEEMNGCPRETIMNILDNISIIMPNL